MSYDARIQELERERDEREQAIRDLRQQEAISALRGVGLARSAFRNMTQAQFNEIKAEVKAGTLRIVADDDESLKAWETYRAATIPTVAGADFSRAMNRGGSVALSDGSRMKAGQLAKAVREGKARIA
jgi:hypothetical protein